MPSLTPLAAFAAETRPALCDGKSRRCREVAGVFPGHLSMPKQQGLKLGVWKLICHSFVRQGV